MILRTSDRLCECEVRRAFAAVTAGFDVEGHFLVVCETGEASALDCGDVDENVLAAVIGSDKAETFGGVEPFHGASSHRVFPFKMSARGSAAARLGQNEIE
jgi:hypothetical protein